MTEEPSRSAVRASRLKLLALLAVFTAPLVAAVGWYFVAPALAPTPSVNGTLIDPARPLEPFALESGDGEAFTRDAMRGHWTLLHAAGDACNASCQQRLYYSRQIRDALGEDRMRVERVVLATQGTSTPGLSEVLPEHPRLRVVRTGEDRALMRQLPPPRSAATIYVIDPLGNLMLRFDAGVEPNAILDDLEHLLKLSRIG